MARRRRQGKGEASDVRVQDVSAQGEGSSASGETAPPVADGSGSQLGPGLTEQQIRDRGWAVAVPFESVGGDPPGLRYAESAEGEEFELPAGWSLDGFPVGAVDE